MSESSENKHLLPRPVLKQQKETGATIPKPITREQKLQAIAHRIKDTADIERPVFKNKNLDLAEAAVIQIQPEAEKNLINESGVEEKAKFSLEVKAVEDIEINMNYIPGIIVDLEIDGQRYSYKLYTLDQTSRWLTPPEEFSAETFVNNLYEDLKNTFIEIKLAIFKQLNDNITSVNVKKEIYLKFLKTDKNTPKEYVLSLMKYPDYKIRQEATKTFIEYYDITLEFLENLPNDIYDNSCGGEINRVDASLANPLNGSIRNERCDVKVDIAKKESELPYEVLVKLANDKNAYVRNAVAQRGYFPYNQKDLIIPDEVREILEKKSEEELYVYLDKFLEAEGWVEYKQKIVTALHKLKVEDPEKYKDFILFTDLRIGQNNISTEFGHLISEGTGGYASETIYFEM